MSSIINIQTVPLNEINPAMYNPRKDLKPDDNEYKMLLQSIDEFGFVEPLIWNKRTNNLVGGHQRYKILRAKGITEIEVVVVDLPPQKEKALNLALNKISGEWDQAKLAQLLDELVKIPDFNIELTGFELPEVEQLIEKALDSSKDNTEDNFDVAAELEKNLPIVTKAGDIIELGMHGQHKIMCGDCTNTAAINKLMGQCRAALCHTDPPYSVNYDRNNRPAASQKKYKTSNDKLQNDNLTPKQYASWFAKVVDSISEVMIPGAPLYIWNSHKNFGLMHDLLTERNFKVASVITWGKESFCPSFGDYNEQVEYCIYGWKCGAAHFWYGPNNESTLWQVSRDRTGLYHHPTQKALELAERAIRNSSKAGDLVFDPFLGGGTTLIAAARLGRRCFGLEIEPKYCDVIVRRYIALAGRDAVSKAIYDRYVGQEVQI